MSDVLLGVGVILSGVFCLALIVWLGQARADASQLRAANETRLRKLGDPSELTARVGDLSEGTLSFGHAQDIARWIREDLP